MKILQNLYLIRHTSVAVAPGICYGRSDVACSQTFASEAAEIAKLLPPNLKIISSPLQRCTSLARALTGETFEIDKRLTELCFGDWELRAWSDIPRTETDPWCENFVESAPPDGESGYQLAARCNSFIADINKRTHGSFGIISHRGCISTILASHMNLAMKEMFTIPCAIGAVIFVTPKETIQLRTS
jgi:alpha-ribazole phosphatase